MSKKIDVSKCNCTYHGGKASVNPKEAPNGCSAVSASFITDCCERCTFSNNLKKCKKAKCLSSTRVDKFDVYFVKDNYGCK